MEKKNEYFFPIVLKIKMILTEGLILKYKRKKKL